MNKWLNGKSLRLTALVALAIVILTIGIQEGTNGEQVLLFICDTDSTMRECAGEDNVETCADLGNNVACVQFACGHQFANHVDISVSGADDPLAEQGTLMNAKSGFVIFWSFVLYALMIVLLLAFLILADTTTLSFIFLPGIIAIINKFLFKRLLNISHCVEILHADKVLVYASAQFQDGMPADDPRQFQLNLQSKATCRLADLSDCRICVGGGFPLESLDCMDDEGSAYEGYLVPNEEWDSDNSKAVRFCFSPNNALCLTVVVHGWPRAAWGPVIEADNVDPDARIDFLVHTVARNYPEATVEFKHVSFLVSNIPGAIKRLLPPKRQEEIYEKIEAYSDLEEYVATTMRDYGYEDVLDENGLHFDDHLREIMSILAEPCLRVHKRSDMHEEIMDDLINMYSKYDHETNERTGRDYDREEFIQEFIEYRESIEGQGFVDWD